MNLISIHRRIKRRGLFWFYKKDFIDLGNRDSFLLT